MNRRNAMIVAGGGVLTLAVVSASPMRAFAQQGRMGEAGERQVRETLRVGGVSLAVSRLAAERAQDFWVKKFANYEIAEQETIRELLTSMGGQAPQDARQEEEEARRKLMGLSGRTFEEAYLDAQARGHNELLEIQETYIRSGGDQEHIGMAKLARGQIKEHVDLIRTIQSQLRA